MAFAMPSASEAFDNTRWTWLWVGLVQCWKEDIRMPVRMGCDPMQCIDGYVGHSEYICRQGLGDMQVGLLACIA